MQKADQSTKDRIKNLAVVGKALNETSTDYGYDTSFFIAKEALSKFREGIHNLDLDQVSLSGMDNLIDFLEKEIDEKLKKEEAF